MNSKCKEVVLPKRDNLVLIQYEIGLTQYTTPNIV